MVRVLTLSILGALLIGCASTDSATRQSSQTAPGATAEPEQVAKVLERPIPDESLYPLLVAEFALRRRAYHVALDQYMEQAPVLRDKKVAKHTTRLAQFMQQDEEALSAVQLWLELEPDNVEAHTTAATMLTRQGGNLEALPHLAVVARSGEQANFPSLLTDFETLDPADQASLAQGIGELALEFPDDPALLLTRAMLSVQQQEYDTALDELGQLFAIEPTQPQALLLEARVLIATEADAPYARIEKTLKNKPDDTRLRLQYARLLTATDMSAARQQFEILSAQSPRDGDLLLSLALINRETGDHLAAKAYLKQMLELEQRVDEAHYYLGRVAEDTDDPKEAVAQFKQVGEGRHFLSANQRLGRLLVDAGALEQSHALFEQQRGTHKQYREQLYGIEADLLTNAGFPGSAMAVLNAGLEDFPDSASLRYTRSMLGEKQNNLALMEADLRIIIANDPANTTALNALGYTLADRTERYTEAYDLISRALELSPEEPAILDSMGWVLYRQGEYEQALQYLTRAYAAFPDPEVAAHLGEVLWVNGNTDEATLIWRGALLQAPDHKTLIATLKRLGVDRDQFTTLPGRPQVSQ